MAKKTSKKSLRLFSWNINGVRAICKKGFYEWLEKESPDIVCLQETKALKEQVAADKIAKGLLELPDYQSHWFSAEKKGYSGTATFTKLEPRRVQLGFKPDDKKKNFNNEGRIVITEFEDFELWNVYFPNGGRGPERVQYKLDFYEHCLKAWEKIRKAGRKLIVCGDYNTAHKEIDLARPKENEKKTGFLPEERAFLDKITKKGYVDVFREFNNEPGWYTYWDQITRARDRNIGWRIDYFFATEETMPIVKNAEIHMVARTHGPAQPGTTARSPWKYSHNLTMNIRGVKCKEQDYKRSPYLFW